MRISFLIPTPNFLERLVPELINLGHEVLVNKCDELSDVIIGMSDSQLSNIVCYHRQFPKCPLVVYNWDWYDFKAKAGGYSQEWIDIMKESKEVWSASRITSEKCEKDTGIKSPVWMYAFIIPEEWEGENNDRGFILQASRQDGYKRFDWFEKAAMELDIPFKSYHPNTNSREDYIKAVKNCSMLVVSSKEESLGTLSAMEGAYNGKPILIGDFEGAKEVWKENVCYFRVNDFEDYKRNMKWLWQNRDIPFVKNWMIRTAKQRVETLFLPVHMANRINDRLKVLFEKNGRI